MHSKSRSQIHQTHTAKEEEEEEVTAVEKSTQTRIANPKSPLIIKSKLKKERDMTSKKIESALGG